MSILLTFPMKAETHIFVHAVSTQLYTLNLLHTSKIFFKARKSHLLESFFLRMPLKKFIYLNSRITYTHKRNREKIFHLPTGLLPEWLQRAGQGQNSARSFFWVSTLVQGSKTWIMLYCFPWLTSTKLDQNWRNAYSILVLWAVA